MIDTIPCLRGTFGDWVYYPALLVPEQINRLVLKSNDIRESETLDDHLQRGITKNLNKILKYIETREDRFFNSIIIGVFDDTPEWFSLDLSSVDFLEENRTSIEDSIGLLRLSGKEKMFAIDGQHRVEAIKKAYLSNTEFDEQISVIFVAHVDNKKGKKRTRRLFSDINKKAQKVSTGELVIIDEEEIENIVARRLYVFMENKYPGSVMVTKTASVSKNSIYFINLITLAKVTGVITKHLSLKKKSDPSEDHIERVIVLVKRFLSIIINKTNLHSVIKENKYVNEREDNKNILLRPVGIEILANVFISCVKNRKQRLFSNKIPKINFKLTSPSFMDIIFVRGKINPKFSKFSCDIILYNLGVIKKSDITIPEGFENNFLNGKLKRL